MTSYIKIASIKFLVSFLIVTRYILGYKMLNCSSFFLVLKPNVVDSKKKKDKQEEDRFLISFKREEQNNKRDDHRLLADDREYSYGN